MSIIPYMEFESPLRMIERSLRPDSDFFFDFPSFNQLVPRQFYSPDYFFKPWDSVFRPWEELMKPMQQLTTAMNKMALQESSKITSDDEKFQINVDVQHFKPEEVTVKVINKHVIVEGKHEEKQDHHGYVSRQFVRRYALPEGCLPDTVESKLSSDGVLTVTAPKVLALPSTGERIVPVTYTGPVQKKIGSSHFDAIKE